METDSEVPGYSGLWEVTDERTSANAVVPNIAATEDDQDKTEPAEDTESFPTETDQCPSDEPYTTIASTGFVSTLEKIKEEIRSSDDRAKITMQARYKWACAMYGQQPVLQCIFGKKLDRTDVDFSDMNLGDLAFRPIVETLFFSNRITKLVLSNTGIGLDVLERVTYLLEFNVGIEYLDIGGNGIGPRCEEYLERILNNSTSLKHLDASANGLKDHQLTDICRALYNSQSLSTLILRGNDFGEVGAIDMAEYLLSNGRLQNLDLSSNKFKTAGAKHIFLSLKSNTSLKRLNLSSNEIGPGCVVELHSALKKNGRLEELGLSQNFLTQEIADPIKKGLESNSTLRHLNLSYNPLTAEGAAILLDAISSNGNNVEFLGLSGVRVDKMFLKTLRKIRASGRSLDVKHGHTMRCELCEASWPLSVSKLADYAVRKGTDLKSVMVKIQADYFAEGINNNKDKVVVVPDSSTKVFMDADRLVQELVKCPITVPELLASQFVFEFASDDYGVDLSEVILKISSYIK